ncbi:MAG TPA: EAL domain-containing protein [Acidobacteriaceae bacterium]
MPFVAQEILRALDQGDFVPYFQPIVELRSKTLHGFELLARWSHPLRGLIPPDEFIPAVERHGLMNSLSEALLRKAFDAIKPFSGNLRLSVNLSPAQLHDRTLPDFLRKIADEGEFDLNRLTAELTESALVDDLHLAGVVAANLKSTGIRLALDDFGTGYSSLLHLQSLPFDELKLDRSFVKSMVESRQSRKITASVMGLGLSLGLRTVCEGIEHQEQADLLLWQGGELGQGWLYGKPMPAEQLAEFLSRPQPAASGGFHSTVSDLSVDLEASPAQQLCQLRAIYHGVPVGLAFVGSDLRYISLNQRLAELNGLPIHAHLGRRVGDVVPAIYEQFEPYLLKALQGEAVSGVEVTRPASDLNRPAKTLMVSYEPARDEAGEVIGVCLSISDISLIKQKEEALRESEDHYRHALELNPQTPWVMDAAGQNISVSSRWEALTNLTPDQTRGHGWMTAVHPEDRAQIVKVLERCLPTGEPMDVEYRISRDGLDWQWMRSRGAPRRNMAGEIIRWYGSVECVDEYKKALEELGQSASRLRAILDTAPAGIVFADSVTDRVIDANPRAGEIFGFEIRPEIVWTDPPWKLTDESDNALDPKDLPLARAMHSGEITTAQGIHLHRVDGSDIWISLTAAPIRDCAGSVIGGVLVVQELDPTTAAENTSRAVKYVH